MRFLLALVLVSQVKALDYTETYTSDDVRLGNGDPSDYYSGDGFYGPNWQCIVRTLPTGLELYHDYIGSYTVPCDGAAGFGPSSTGTIDIYDTSGNVICTVGSAQPSGKYSLYMDDSCNLKIRNSAGTDVWKFGVNVTGVNWGFPKVMGCTWESTWYTPVSAAYKPPVFLPDAYTTNSEYWTAHSEEISRTIMDISDWQTWVYDTRAALADANLTYAGTGVFTEKDYVKTLNDIFYADYDQKSTKATSIVNFSAALRNQTSLPPKCGLQWLYYAGITVLSAAGNSNTNLTERNPYHFVVGGADYDYSKQPSQGVIWTNSSYGKQVDIWAPIHLRHPRIKGTSKSVAIATAVMIKAYNNWSSQLWRNPGRAYYYLSYLARTDFLPSSDPKVKSSYGKTKLLDGSRVTTTAPPNYSYLPSTLPDYCSQLKLPKSNPAYTDWNNLISKASTTNLGDFVGTFSTGACGCFQFPGSTCRC